MKLYDKNCKSRFDLYDIKNNLNDVKTLTIFPFAQEYHLSCPVQGRAETIDFLTVTSWGDLCYINICHYPHENDNNLMNAKMELILKTKNNSNMGILYAYEEDVLNINQLVDYRGNITKYKIGSFLFEIKRPCVNWRLVFRGFFKNKKNDKKIFATLHLSMVCIGKVFDNLTDCDADFMRKQFKNKPIELNDSFEQWIQMKGQLQIENESQPKDLYFWGLYQKSFETLPLMLNHLIAWNHKGMAFHIYMIENISKQSKNLYGNLNMGLGLNYPLMEIPKIQLNNIDNVRNVKFDINLLKKNRIYSVEIDANNDNDVIQLKDNLWAFPLKFKGYNSYGFWYRQNLNIQKDNILKNICLKSNFNQKEDKQDEELFFVSLEDKEAQNEELTGGKGSSLAILKDFSKKSPNLFYVPEAIIVTSKAYEKFLNNHSDLKEQIEKFSKNILNHQNNHEDIKVECEKIKNNFNNHSLNNELKDFLKRKLSIIFNDKIFIKTSQEQEEYYKFAIRSSAVGEDSQEMSAAGQMDTFLGVSSFESICKSIIACWASQFGQTAVEYKRGYGQKINSPMAVVIQKMVPSQVAGVMFTCSPLNGNERFITINANYGLGESVVSGKIEPDTYTVKVDVDNEPRTILEIDNIIVGTKKHTIHMNEGATSLNEESEIEKDLIKIQEASQTERNVCCLNNEQILQLARIGLDVHAHYGNVRDIEFGYVDGVWFLFQSRPITNFESLTEWEIMHECDTGHASENEIMSRANIGEVMPGASSYNLINFTVRPWASMSFSAHCKFSGQPLRDFIPYINTGWACSYNIPFFAMKTQIGIMGRTKPEAGNAFIHGFEYSLLGHKNENIELFKDIFEKMPDQNTGLIRLFRIFGSFMKSVFTANKLNKKAYKKFENYSIPLNENMNSKEIFEKICQEIPSIRKVLLNHLRISQVSMFHNAALYHFLVTNSGIKDEREILNLFSLITSSVDDVFSAQVPKRLLEISSDIIESEKFLQFNDKEAIDWLKNNNEKFVKFLLDYGHRGYKEFDLYALQWNENPISLIHSLKSLLNCNKNSQNDKQIEIEKKDLKKYNLDHYPQLSCVQKKILKSFMIPRSHQGIRGRELGKNLLIKTYDQFRKMFYALGERLVGEGKIPDRQLVFFMLNDELREIVEHKTNPLIILNAKNRLRLHSKKESFKFDEETVGYELKPRNLIPKQNLQIDSVKLTGVPISSGKIIARCCVAETLEEAKNIKKGDILITYSTDIGWSPYFAALGGLVTEIGGLVSHGAVIAREYGLPCLIGVDKATSYFVSGDILLLDTASGFIAKVNQEEGEE